MTFAWPHLLWLLVVPLALLGAEMARRRRAATVIHPKILHAEAGSRELSLVSKPARLRRIRPWLLVGLALVIVALARPQWGHIEEPVFDQAREILIAIDLSRSMLSPDVKPTRLERAKLLTQSLLERLAGERVGLVTFAGTAFLQSPLSSDYEILREFLPALNPDFLPEGGTNYRALIDTSLTAFGSTAVADRFLIILSDGEATDDDWRSEIPQLKKRGIRVIGLGVGTADGAMIPDGAGGFMKDERGAVVLSRLENSTLQELAQATNGTYRDASSWVDLASVLSATVEAGQKGKFLEKNTVRQVERFQWPLALGLWCLFVSYVFEFPVRPRPRDLKLAPRAPSSASSPLAISALLVFLVGLSGTPPARAAGEPAPPMPLARIVSRLAAQDSQSARDWAEFARETVTWGQHIQSESRPIPPGPVRDALSAVELGAKLDLKTADWPKLRSELEALLVNPESKKQDQPSQQQQPNQQPQKQDQQQKEDPQTKGQPKENSPSQSKPNQSQQKSEANQPAKPENAKPGDSAFGNMQGRPKQEPPTQDTQMVGGTPEHKDDGNKPADPQLTLPLQKLDQLRNQDSPAELFQLMDANKKTATKKPGKDW